MAQNIDLMIVYGQVMQYSFLARDAEYGEIPCWYGPFDEAARTLAGKELNPKVAIIHLGMETIDKDNAHGELIETVFKLLPKATRRILICGGIKTAEQGMRLAIQLGGDEIYPADDFEIEDKRLKLDNILKRGWASKAEISARYQSIEIDGKRREAGLRRNPDFDRERDDYFRRPRPED